VTAMGGILQNNRSPDVNFVIVKDVTAVKYKVSYDRSCKHICTVPGVVLYMIVLYSI
jgi:hypothetical protein